MKYDPLRRALHPRVNTIVLPTLESPYEDTSLTDMDPTISDRICGYHGLFYHALNTDNLYADYADTLRNLVPMCPYCEGREHFMELPNPLVEEVLAIGAYGDEAVLYIHRHRRSIPSGTPVATTEYRHSLRERYPVDIVPRLFVSQHTDVDNYSEYDYRLPVQVGFVITPKSECLSLRDTVSKAIELTQSVVSLPVIANATGFIRSYVLATRLKY